MKVFYIYLQSFWNLYLPGTILACLVGIWIIGRLERASELSQSVVAAWDEKQRQ